MKNRNYLIVIFFGAVLFTVSSCNRTQPADHQTHDSHLMKVNEQGDKVMGFSHEKTTHHFRLFKSGGAIEVTTKDALDAASRDNIRAHLGHIAQMFGAGNFNAPMLTHGKTPPGVPVLQSLKSEVVYTYEEIENGGRVRINTNNSQALAAVHEFLRFQITDHQTGDSLDAVKD